MIPFLITSGNFHISLNKKEFGFFFLFDLNKGLALMGKNDFEINSCLQK